MLCENRETTTDAQDTTDDDGFVQVSRRSKHRRRNNSQVPLLNSDVPEITPIVENFFESSVIDAIDEITGNSRPFSQEPIEEGPPDKITTLIWFDVRLSRNSEKDIEETKELLVQLNERVEFFSRSESLIHYIVYCAKETIFLVISGSEAASVLKRIHHYRQLDTVFIFCLEVEQYLPLRTLFEKVQGVFNVRQNLIHCIRFNIRRVEKQAVAFGLYNSNQRCTVSLTNEGKKTFAWYKKLKDIILEMSIKEQAKLQMINACRSFYRNSKRQLDHIKRFAETYRQDTAVRWYTNQAFLYRIINRALRTGDITALYAFRFYIKDLCAQLAELHHGKQGVITVYRGMRLHIDEICELVANEGGFIATNGFLSCTRSQYLAELYAGRGENSDRQYPSVVVEVIADYQVPGTVFADISHLSEHPDEEEVLFDLGSTFRVESVVGYWEINAWHIKFVLVERQKELADQYLDLKQEIFKSLPGSVLFGELLFETGNYKRTIEYYNSLLLKYEENEVYVAHICRSMGRAHESEGNNALALIHYQWAYDLFFAHRCTDEIAGTLTLLARAMDQVGDSDGAYALVRDTEFIIRRMYSDSQVNEMSALFSLQAEDFDEARQYYCESLECHLETLNTDPRKAGECSYKLVAVCKMQKDYPSALKYCMQSLQYLEPILPSNHALLQRILEDIAELRSLLDETTKKASAVVSDNSVSTGTSTTIGFTKQSFHSKPNRKREYLIQIYDGSEIRLIMDDNETILDLQKAIYRKCDIPVADQNFLGIVFVDNRRLLSTLSDTELILTSPEKRGNVRVWVCTGRSIDLRASPTILVRDIKGLIENMFGIPKEFQKLAIGRIILKDDAFFRDYKYLIRLNHRLCLDIDLDLGESATYKSTFLYLTTDVVFQIKLWNGRTVEVIQKPVLSVSNLKLLLQDITGIHTSIQHLRLNNETTLEDEQLLVTYKIDRKTIIYQYFGEYDFLPFVNHTAPIYIIYNNNVNTLKLSVPVQYSVTDLKWAIQSALGIPVNEQRLSTLQKQNDFSELLDGESIVAILISATSVVYLSYQTMRYITLNITLSTREHQFRIVISTDTTIGKFKEWIMTNYYVPPTEQYIYFRYGLLSNEKASLTDCDLIDESHVYIIIADLSTDRILDIQIDSITTIRIPITKYDTEQMLRRSIQRLYPIETHEFQLICKGHIFVLKESWSLNDDEFSKYYHNEVNLVTGKTICFRLARGAFHHPCRLVFDGTHTISEMKKMCELSWKIRLDKHECIYDGIILKDCAVPPMWLFNDSDTIIIRRKVRLFYVQVSKHRRIPFEWHPSMKIIKIKQALHSRLFLPVVEQCLWTDRLGFNDDSTIRQCEILPETIIFLSHVIRIYISNIKGKRFTFKAETSCTIAQLKGVIFKVTGVPVSKQQLVYQGNHLSLSTKTLDNYLINDERTVLLLPSGLTPSENIDFDAAMEKYECEVESTWFSKRNVLHHDVYLRFYNAEESNRRNSF